MLTRSSWFVSSLSCCCCDTDSALLEFSTSLACAVLDSDSRRPRRHEIENGHDVLVQDAVHEPEREVVEVLAAIMANKHAPSLPYTHS